MSKTNSFLKKPVATQKTAGKGDKKKGLGRGLGSLLSDSSLVSSHSAIESVSKQEDVASRQEQKVIELPILEIERSPYQPRREFSETQIQELADSIKNNGLVQPPVVRKNSSGKWELISGERRLRAAQLLNWRKIEVVVRDVDDITAATMTQTENLQREDLNPIEEAESYKILQDSFSLSQQDVAERVGKARATVANAVRLLELPEEVRELVSKRLLSVGHAKVILSLDSEKDRVLRAPVLKTLYYGKMR
jgi:ParB family chromosome partitioning protein